MIISEMRPNCKENLIDIIYFSIYNLKSVLMGSVVLVIEFYQQTLYAI